jgi:uncharacterized cupin superfamily protein
MNNDDGANIVRTQSEPWQSFSDENDKHDYQYKELSGEHLGARIEELAPGGTSSHHHFHTSEEEHLFMLTGEAILLFGDEEIPVSVGDHIWFRAGDENAHHFENRSDSACSYLVYGERKADDVVLYPIAGVMMVKALGNRQFTYRPRHHSKEDKDD